MKQFFEAARLDAALRSGENSNPELAGLLKTAQKLKALGSVPPLEKEALNQTKAAFLARATAIAPHETMATVTTENTSWRAKLKEAFQFTQGRTWVPVTAILALVLMVFALFGFAQLDRAAQTSLVGDPLYTYKIVKEDLSASLTFDAYQKVMVYLEQIHKRQEEIACYAQTGQALPQETVSRLEKLLQAALKTASQLPDPEMQASLAEIRQASEDLGTTIAQAKPSVQEPVDNGALEQAETAAKESVVLADQGLQDPEGFRVNMAAPKPVVNLPTPTSAAQVVYPPVEPTPVVGWPTPTLGIMNPPLNQPTPTCTCTPTEAAQPTATNPPPILPTPTEIYIQPTQALPTPSPTPTPTPTQMPQPPTATPVQMQQDGE